MTEDKRYRVYKRGNYYAIDDNIGQVAVISCIRTEIEAEWLCNLLNNLTEENNKNGELLKENYGLQDGLDFYKEQNAYLSEQINELEIKLNNIKEICNKYRIPSFVSVKMPRDCKYRNTCLNNNIISAQNAGKSEIAKQILKISKGDCGDA